MLRTITVITEIPSDREVHITLPEDIPPGPAEILIVVASHAEQNSRTLGDLARSEFVGMWADRTDIGDSAEFARRLREEAWRASE